MHIRALTVRQPWATLIAAGRKTIETRRRAYSLLIGTRLAIHAGKAWDDAGAQMARRYLQARGFTDADIDDLYGDARRDLGYVLALATVEKIIPLDESHAPEALCDITEGLRGYVLTDLRQLRMSYPVRGQQGIWTWTLPAAEAEAERMEVGR